jgi:acyl-CoA synthetase (AMP-forming)/AMP-acid ligase II/aryl carrier-like protein
MTPKLAEFLDLESLQHLDTIELAGEQADPRQVGRIRHMGTTKVRFAYGPAEASIMSTVSSDAASCSSIGTGLGIRTWVVESDDPTKLAPLGSVGELWIEGPLVGRCYLNDEHKTAAAFVKDPKWLGDGAASFPGRSGRLYKTGDLVKYDGENGYDGSLVFVGRRDAQVKIHGQRVDLGEVEHQMLACLSDGAYQSSKLAVEMISPRGSNKHAMLAAFVQATNSSAVVAHLRYTLPDQLPHFMLPSFYIPIDEMPEGTTGKTDRRRLRELGSSFSLEELTNSGKGRSREWTEPQTANERQLRALWATVLGVQEESIGAEDSFFHIGGDSLRAMRLVSKAREVGRVKNFPVLMLVRLRIEPSTDHVWYRNKRL